jgi:hypothetical protein
MAGGEHHGHAAPRLRDGAVDGTGARRAERGFKGGDQSIHTLK